MSSDPTFETQVLINAPIDLCWRVLCDTASYPTWNPSMPRADGTPAPGGKVVLHLAVTPHIHARAPVKVLEFAPPNTLVWQGGLSFAKSLVNVTHSFFLRPQGAQTEFVNHEVFAGALCRLAAPLLKLNMTGRYPVYNAAFKARCEALARR